MPSKIVESEPVSQLILSFVVIFATNIAAHVNAQTPSPIVITNCNVVSVNDGRIIPKQMILIKDGLIASTGPMQESSVPESALVIDGTDKYVIPGLVDMHVHIGHKSELLSFLMNGVTTVCNMGGDYVDLFSDERIDILELKKQVESGTVIGPAIYSAGQALDGDPRTGPYQRALPNTTAAAEAVMEQKKNGFDFIKIYDSMDEPLLKTITRTAAEAELAVVGHIPEKVSINKLLNSGVKLVAHGEEFYPAFEDSEDIELTAKSLAKQVKESGVAVTPNSAFIRRMIDQLEDLPTVLDDPKVKNLAPRVRRWWNPQYNFYTTRDEPAKFLEQTRRKYQWLMILVRELHKAGVPLLTGTDASIPGALPGYSMMEEFKDLDAAGLSAAEILRTATINPAKFILDNTSASTRFGKVRAGYRADLVLLNQNPLENISALDQSVIGVVFNGRWATKESLRKLLDEQVKKFDR